MRRGRLDLNSVILILLSGFFALLSFAMDQSAIQTEDKVRDTNVEYQKDLFTFTTSRDKAMALNNFTHIIGAKEESLFVIAHFLVSINEKLLNDQYIKDSFKDINTDEGKQFVENTKYIYRFELLDHYKLILNEFKFALELLNALNLNETRFQSDLQKVRSIYDIDFEYHYKILNEGNSKDFFTYKEIRKYYNEMWELITRYDQVVNQLEPIGKTFTEDIPNFGDKLLLTSDKIISLKSYKNYFILFGIFFQILGLVFLLLLFRNLLRIIKPQI